MTDTEIEITADLVRDLLQEQHPGLAGLAIREVAGGWGNQMWSAHVVSGMCGHSLAAAAGITGRGATSSARR
jgi:aminoglycoside phosphotransferase (APT) family kinase protein